jgi:hypothetical protein
MKLKQPICVGMNVIPAGTELRFGAEAEVNALLVPFGAIEANGSELAELFIRKLTDRYPEGFTKKQIIDDFGDKIEGNAFTVMQVDDENVLILKTADDEAIELYLIEDACVYKFTGEYHVASNIRQGVAVEDDSKLITKGTLAIRVLVKAIGTVLDELPSYDRPELIRILRVASQSVSSGNSKTFYQNIGRGIVS